MTGKLWETKKMASTVKKAVVFGAGSMGAGIAAQFANAGVPVLLLDVASDEGRRSAAAEAGVARQLKAGGFMHPSRAELVKAGNIEDDLSGLSEVDWIVEAVIEDLAIKRDLFTRIDAARKPDSIISSNTSTIPLERLVDGQSKTFGESFAITHFFNPPRVMALVEVVAGRATTDRTQRLIREAGEEILGKTLLDCRDTPGFVANRIGCFWIAMAIIEALKAGLPIEEADAIAGRPFRIPASGAFALLDLIGVDLVPHVWGSLQRQLPQTDLLWSYDLNAQPLIQRMIRENRIGRKGDGGFYRLVKSGATRGREVLDPATFDYHPERTANPTSSKGIDLRGLCESEGAAGRFAWRLLSRTVLYASTVAPEIANTVADIDLGMRLGYGWAEGPFEMADRLNAAWIAERLKAGGETVPPLLAKAVDTGFYTLDGSALTTAAPFPSRKSPHSSRPLAGLKLRTVFENNGAVLSDIGDGVLCLEHKTNMAVYDEHVFAAIGVALDETPKAFRALVIGSDHPRAFSCGADLSYFFRLVNAGDFSGLEAFLLNGQERFLGLKYAPFPVVAAAFGLALGGGCETLLHVHEIVAHAELNAGMPEASRGILPGWGGCTQMAARWRKKDGVVNGPVAWLAEPFALILGSRVSGSALEARDLGILRSRDLIVMSRARVIAKAKARAIELADGGWKTPEPDVLFLPGLSGKSSLMSTVHSQFSLGRISANDLAIAEALATILSGGATDPLRPMTEQEVMTLEREAVLSLARRPATRERIEHLLATN
jgi:3-hydroxyacyl-CoA dehydrogenase